MWFLYIHKIGFWKCYLHQPSYTKWQEGTLDVTTALQHNKLQCCGRVSKRRKNYRLKMFYQTCTARRPPKGPIISFFVPGDLDLWPSNSSERGTKHVFGVNLAQICSAVPKTFHTQKNHKLMVPKTTFRSSLRVVTTGFKDIWTMKWKARFRSKICEGRKTTDFTSQLFQQTRCTSW